jgi:alpha-ketoglutarate-dependent 2,4-dichlorophenoxyacetate dioxygenase
MGLEAKPILAHFGAELSGVDIARRLSKVDRDAIVAAIETYGVVVFHDTGLDDDSHIAFSAALGEVYSQPPVKTGARRQLPQELFEAGNIGPDNEIDMRPTAQFGRRGNEQWHTDHSFMPERSAYSLLLAHEIPEGQGDTGFADMRGAYTALPAEMKARIEGLIATHSIWYSRMTGGYPVTEDEIRDRGPMGHHPIVQTHVGSGRKTLYIASHIRAIAGMPDDEARALACELVAFATQPQFVFKHRWKVGDLVIWDNRCTMHRAYPFPDEEYRRDLRRTNVLDTIRLPEQAAA